MPIARPYYRLHQIVSGQYATKGELVTADGLDYEGAYHVLPNSNIFSEYNPADKSVQLYYKRVDIADMTLYYNKVKKIPQAISRYTSPKFHSTFPTQQDYKDGYLYRYFAQKRNNPLDTLIEISYSDFTSANLGNAPGISLQLYNITSVKWIIARASRDEAADLNKKATLVANELFPGLINYLQDFSEFYQIRVV